MIGRRLEAARRVLPTTVLIVAVAASGCGRSDDPATGESSEEGRRPSPVAFETSPFLAGDLMLIEGRLRFRTCGQGDAQPVDDETGGEARRALEELGGGEGRIAAIVVLREGRLIDLRHAAADGVGCERLVRDGDVQALGNEPFWNVRIAGDEARWRSPEELEGVRYRGGVWEKPADDRWRFEASREGVDGVQTLTLELVEVRCRDTMAGFWYPFTARLRLGGQTFEGCAVEGGGGVAGP